MSYKSQLDAAQKLIGEFLQNGDYSALAINLNLNPPKKMGRPQFTARYIEAIHEAPSLEKWTLSENHLMIGLVYLKTLIKKGEAYRRPLGDLCFTESNQASGVARFIGSIERP